MVGYEGPPEGGLRLTPTIGICRYLSVLVGIFTFSGRLLVGIGRYFHFFLVGIGRYFHHLGRSVFSISSSTIYLFHVPQSQIACERSKFMDSEVTVTK